MHTLWQNPDVDVGKITGKVFTVPHNHLLALKEHVVLALVQTQQGAQWLVSPTRSVSIHTMGEDEGTREYYLRQKSALRRAIALYHPGVVDMLLREGIFDANREQQTLSSALIDAAGGRFFRNSKGESYTSLCHDMIHVLLRHGTYSADVLNRALEAAVRENYYQTVHILVQHGARVTLREWQVKQHEDNESGQATLAALVLGGCNIEVSDYIMKRGTGKLSRWLKETADVKT